jgi:CRP-like cAMP-binding protein
MCRRDAMSLGYVPKSDVHEIDSQLKGSSGLFLGSYTPFAGVRYYVMLNEEDIREGRTRLGPVGWRVDRTQAEVIPQAPDPGSEGKTSALKRVDIFKGLSEEQIERVASLGRRMRVPPGYVLGMAGELVSRLFIIISGEAELSAQSAIGEITIRTAGPGEAFPLTTLIGSGTLITSATAMTEMDLLAIPRSRLLALCHEDTDIGMRLYAAVAEVLAGRYASTLAHLTSNAEAVLRQAGYFANV